MTTVRILYDLIARDGASRGFQSAGRSAGQLETRLGKLSHAANVAATAIAGGAVLIGAESVKMAVNFQASMTKIHTQAGASTAEVNKMTKAVEALGGKVQQGPQELADSLYHLESVGLRGAKAMSALKTASNLAAVGGANLEDVTNAVAGAWRSGIKGAKTFNSAAATINATIGAGNMRMEDYVAAIGTGILPAAKTFGLSLKQVGAALALMTDEGIPAQDAATRLRMSFSLLGAPSAAADKQLQKIGLSGLQLANAMRGPQGIIGAISLLKQHLDASGLSASKQAQVLSRAFGGGRSSSAILTLLNNLDVLKKKQQQVNDSTGKYGAAVKAQQKTASAQFAMLQSAIETTGVKIGSALLPPLTKFVNFLNRTVIPDAGKVAKFLTAPDVKPWTKIFGGIAAAALAANAIHTGLQKAARALGLNKVSKIGKTTTEVAAGNMGTAADTMYQASLNMLRAAGLEDKAVGRSGLGGAAGAGEAGAAEAGTVAGLGAAALPVAVGLIGGLAIAWMVNSDATSKLSNAMAHKALAKNNLTPQDVATGKQTGGVAPGISRSSIGSWQQYDGIVQRTTADQDTSAKVMAAAAQANKQLAATFSSRVIPQLAKMHASTPKVRSDVSSLAEAILDTGNRSDSTRGARQKLIKDLENAGLNARQATGLVHGLQGRIDSLKGRTVQVGVHGSGSGNITFAQQILGQNKKGFLEFHAQGGMIRGGIPGRDSVLSALMPGELVVPTHMVRAGAVDHLRGRLPGFAQGGLVGGASVLDRGVPFSASAGGSFMQAAEQQFAEAAVSAARSAMRQAVSALSASMGDTGARTHSAAVAQAYARSILGSHGWGASQFPPLVALWNRESGWSADAVNAASGAYGIPQSLGHGHPYALGDYKSQIIWGENYIAGRYGSPAAAWAHESAVGWYAKGTPGARRGWAWVGERGPELVKFGGGEHVLDAGTSAKIASGALAGYASGTSLAKTGRELLRRHHRGVLDREIANTRHRIGSEQLLASAPGLGAVRHHHYAKLAAADKRRLHSLQHTLDAEQAYRHQLNARVAVLKATLTAARREHLGGEASRLQQRIKAHEAIIRNINLWTDGRASFAKPGKASTAAKTAASTAPTALTFSAYLAAVSNYGSVPAFARGSMFVPATGPAVVHRGEMILPAAVAGAVRDALGSGGGGDITVRVYIGDRELTDVVRTEISEGNRQTRRRAAAGAGRAR